MKTTKTFLFILGFLLFLSTKTNAQDTTYTIKTINKDRQITAYLVVTICNKIVIKTERIESYLEIENRNLRRQAKAKIDLSKIPLDKLEPEEYLKNGLRDNKIK